MREIERVEKGIVETHTTGNGKEREGVFMQESKHRKQERA